MAPSKKTRGGGGSTSKTYTEYVNYKDALDDFIASKHGAIPTTMRKQLQEKFYKLSDPMLLVPKTEQYMTAHQKLSRRVNSNLQGGTTKSGAKVHTGPRGGKYIMRGGRKVYV